MNDVTFIITNALFALSLFVHNLWFTIFDGICTLLEIFFLLKEHLRKQSGSGGNRC